MLLLRTSVLFLLTVLGAGCSINHHEKSRQPMTASPRETPWNMTYHDGSGNGFRFWQASEDDRVRFTYTPITPETSSSGLYDGGEAKHGEVDDEQVEELWRWVQRLESDTSLHAPSRTMGSGAFRLTTPGGVRAFIVKGNAPLRAFNAFLIGVRDG